MATINTPANSLTYYDNGQTKKLPENAGVTLSGADAVLTATNVVTSDLQVNGGANITGNLNVLGDIVSGGAVNVVLRDSFLDLNGGNTITGAVTAGGLAVNVEAIGTLYDATTFTARSGTVNPTVTITGDATGAMVEGKLIQISSSLDGRNDGQYVVYSSSLVGSDTVVVVKGSNAADHTVNMAATPFAHNDFDNETLSTAKLTLIRVTVISATNDLLAGPPSSLTPTALPTGSWCYASGVQEDQFLGKWTSLTPAAAASLQDAYNASSVSPSPAVIELADGKDLNITPAVGATAAFSITASAASTIAAAGSELLLGGAGGSVAFATKTKLPVDGRTVVAFAGNALTQYALAYYDATGSYIAASSDVACIPVGTAFDGESFSCVPGTFIRALGKTGSSWVTGATLWMSDEPGKVHNAPPTTGRVFVVGVALAPYDQTLDLYADIRFQPQYVIDLP